MCCGHSERATCNLEKASCRRWKHSPFHFHHLLFLSSLYPLLGFYLRFYFSLWSTILKMSLVITGRNVFSCVLVRPHYPFLLSSFFNYEQEKLVDCSGTKFATPKCVFLAWGLFQAENSQGPEDSGRAFDFPPNCLKEIR